MLLVDTDVLVDFLRGVKKAGDYLENISESLLLSSITIAELYAGVKGKKEQDMLARFLKLFQVISVDIAVAELGGEFRRQYGKSHGTGLADALIAATAVLQGANLVSLNAKHFPMIKSLVIPYTK